MAQKGAKPLNIIAKTSTETMSAAEWQARVDLAAVYRLVAHHGWDDLIYTTAPCAFRGKPENS
jgi:hypothetical protein